MTFSIIIIIFEITIHFFFLVIYSYVIPQKKKASVAFDY